MDRWAGPAPPVWRSHAAARTVEVAAPAACPAALRAALEYVGIGPTYDCPGDTPIIVGTECYVCKAEWNNKPKHKPECPLAYMNP